MEEYGPQYLVDGVRLRPSDTAWQQALERAHAGGAKPLCLCRPDGVPMYIARYEQFVVKRLPDCPLYMERKAGERFKKVFECEYEAWVHQRSAEQAGQVDPWRLRFLFCGLVYAKREGVYFVDTATLVTCSSTWIPLDQPYEHVLIDQLIRQERRFLKPLRFESKQGAAFPNAVLLDTGDAETPLDIVTPFMSDRDRTSKQRALSQRAGEGWVWNMQTEQEPPRLPAVALSKAEQALART